MDSTQARLVEKYQHAKLDNKSEDEDDLLELLDEDNDVLAQYREARIQQLSKEFSAIDESQRSDENFGAVTEVANEKDLMEAVTQAQVSIVHFHQPTFAKCKVMAQRLEHLTIKIYAIKAELAPFLVTKLNIKVLPCVVIYKNGKEVDRLVGFEKLGNTGENFEYSALEDYLYRHKLLNRKSVNFNAKIRSTNHDSDSDLDL